MFFERRSRLIQLIHLEQRRDSHLWTGLFGLDTLKESKSPDLECEILGIPGPPWPVQIPGAKPFLRGQAVSCVQSRMFEAIWLACFIWMKWIQILMKVLVKIEDDSGGVCRFYFASARFEGIARGLDLSRRWAVSSTEWQKLENRWN